MFLRHCQPRHASLGLLLLLVLILGGACSRGEEEPKGKILAFKEKVDSLLAEARDALPPPYGEPQAAALGERLAEFFKKRADSNARLHCAVAVVSSEGRVLASRKPAPGMPAGVDSRRGDMNYSRYDGLGEVLRKGRRVRFAAFFPGGKVLVVCMPLEEDCRVAAALCLSYDPETLHKKHGVKEEDFLDLDFDS